MAATSLLASLVLGGWAMERARTAAYEDWENGHAPSLLIWRHALGARGFKSIIEPELAHRIFRSLPSRLSDSRIAWINDDGTWVILPGTSDSGQPLAFCERCPRQAKGWRPFDFSWKGFESLLGEIDRIRAQRPPEPARRAVSDADPREIRY